VTGKLTAQQVIDLLGLEPHVEGGFYRQTFADVPDADGRPASTLIYYMLTDNKAGTWHRVDSAEVWHWYAGAPMLLGISPDGSTRPVMHRLGNDLAAGERPQVVVPPGAWQQARVEGDWSLVGCTVAPGFLFSKFEQAEPGWEPGQVRPS
jgi:predicted cupin superfamily sugar epimerase